MKLDISLCRKDASAYSVVLHTHVIYTNCCWNENTHATFNRCIWQKIVHLATTSATVLADHEFSSAVAYLEFSVQVCFQYSAVQNLT